VINAGGDVTLAGSQVKGKRVELDAENLNIESLQDKSSYHGKQMNVSGSVSANFETPFGENGAAQSTKQATDKDGNLLYTDKNGNKILIANLAQQKVVLIHKISLLKMKLSN